MFEVFLTAVAVAGPWSAAWYLKRTIRRDAERLIKTEITSVLPKLDEGNLGTVRKVVRGEVNAALKEAANRAVRADLAARGTAPVAERVTYGNVLPMRAQDY